MKCYRIWCIGAWLQCLHNVINSFCTLLLHMLLECCTSRRLDSLAVHGDNLSIWLLLKHNHSSDINGKTYFEIAGLAPVNVHNFYEGLLEVRPHLPIPHTLINMINTQSQATNSFKLHIIVAASSHYSCWRRRWLFYTLWVTLIVAWHTAPNSGCTYKCAYGNLPKILGQNYTNPNPELFHISGNKLMPLNHSAVTQEK